MDTRQRAIPTRFDGFRFRSMLEARWAVFFNALDIKYLYEPQGFVTDGKPYLPDFCLLLGRMVWAEVKPAIETDADGVTRWETFVRARNGNGVLLTDMTSRPGPFKYLGEKYGESGGYQFEDWAEWAACGHGYHFAPTPACAALECESCSVGCTVWFGDYQHLKIAAAYELARSYQFDRR